MRVLIVEDEILVAMEFEETLTELGHDVIGIAADRSSALALATRGVDVALVDVNLRDGETGVDIARQIASSAAVVFITANSSLIKDRVPGVVGVLPKPAARQDLAGAVSYAGMARDGAPTLPAPPAALQLFI